MPTYEYMQRYYTEGGKLIIEEVMWTSEAGYQTTVLDRRALPVALRGGPVNRAGRRHLSKPVQKDN